MTRWCYVVGGFTLGGLVLGCALGHALAWLSVDYIVVPDDYAWPGLRAGLFAGTVLAASQLGFEKPMLARGEQLRSFAILAIVAAIAMMVAAGAGLAFGPAHWAASDEWLLAHPRRHAVFLALDNAWLGAALVGTIVASLWSWRRRVAMDAMRQREPKQEVQRKQFGDLDGEA